MLGGQSGEDARADARGRAAVGVMRHRGVHWAFLAVLLPQVHFKEPPTTPFLIRNMGHLWSVSSAKMALGRAPEAPPVNGHLGVLPGRPGELAHCYFLAPPIVPKPRRTPREPLQMRPGPCGAAGKERPQRPAPSRPSSGRGHRLRNPWALGIPWTLSRRLTQVPDEMTRTTICLCLMKSVCALFILF